MRAGLALLALAGLLGSWLDIAPNRLLPGTPVSGLDALGPGAAALALAALGAAALASRPGPGRWGALALAGGALLIAVGLTGAAAEAALAGRPPAARAMLGAGFWTASAALLVLALAVADETGRRGAGAALGIVLAAGLAALALSGALDALSLMVEIRARADRLGTAIGEHLRLSGTALALALALAAPLAAAAFRWRPVARGADAALGLVQVVPALALFAGLIPLIAGLLAAVPALRTAGVSALGPAPALLAVALYAALPLYRALLAGLTQADAGAVEAARAMGMGPWRIAAEIRVPLGFPLLFGALRLAAVQAIGLVTLGGLVGAGGLGAVLFEGMAQFAPDLILAAAAPIVILAVAADLGLRALEAAARARLGAAPA